MLTICSCLSLAYADAGVDPIDFPSAPTVALPIALQKANLTINDIARFEVNEAFSAVVRIAEKILNLDPAKVNVDGYVMFPSSTYICLYCLFQVVPSHWDMLSETLARESSCPWCMALRLVNTARQVSAMV